MGLTLEQLIGLGIGGYSVYQGAQQSKKAGQLSDEAIGVARDQWADRKPFRDMALRGAQSMGPVDSSGLFMDSGNPYASQYAAMHSRDLGAEMMGNMAGGGATPSQGVPIGETGDGRGMTPNEKELAQNMYNFRAQEQNPIRPPGMPYNPLPGMPNQNATMPPRADASVAGVGLDAGGGEGDGRGRREAMRQFLQMYSGRGMR